MKEVGKGGRKEELNKEEKRWRNEEAEEKAARGREIEKSKNKLERKKGEDQEKREKKLGT